MLSPARGDASARLLQWLEHVDGEGRFSCRLSPSTRSKKHRAVGAQGRTAEAAGLKVWLAGLVAIGDDKIIPIDAHAAALAGQLEAKAICAGYDPGMSDAAIAGIAKARKLMIITLNKKPFLPFGIDVATPDEVVRSA